MKMNQCALWLFVLSFALPLSGYSNQRENNPNDMERLLNLSIEELMNEEITTAGKTSEKISEIPASVVVVTREEIAAYGYSTLAEILEHISGLYLHQSYEIIGIHNYGVRGFFNSMSNRNMIILVNGVNQVFDRDSTTRLPRVLVPVEAIDRIEIVRGALSVVYGSGAFFGAINIITNQSDKQRNADRTHNLISVGIGSEKTHKEFVRFSGVDKDWDYTINAGSYGTAGADIPYSDMQVTPSPGVSGLSSGGRLENNEKSFDLNARYKNFSLAFNYARSKMEGFFPFPSLAEGSFQLLEATTLRLGYQSQLNNKLRLEARLDYFDINTYFDYIIVSSDFMGDQTQAAYGYDGEVDLFWTISPRFDLTVGLHYRNVLDVSDKYDLPSFNRPSTTRVVRELLDNETITTQALFAQANYQITDRLKLVLGVRFEQLQPYGLYAHQASGTPDYSYLSGIYSDDQDVRVIPRLAAIYQLNQKNIFKLLYGEAINRPAFSQNVANTLLDSARGNLSPEYIKTLELNYITELGKNYISHLSIFHNKFDNLIIRRSALSPNGDYAAFYDNGGELVTNGTEWTLQAQPLPHLDFELGLTYQKTTDKTFDIPVPYSPNWLGQLKGCYHFNDNTTLALTSYYVDDMETYFDPTLKNTDGSYGRYIGDKTNGYFLTSANLRLNNIFGKGSFVNLHVYNLFDKEVRYPTLLTNTWATKSTVGNGRSWMFSVGYKF